MELGRRWFGLLVVASLGVVFLCSCGTNPGSTGTESASTARHSDSPTIPAGELMDEHITFEFAVYYLPTPTGDPLAVLDGLLASDFTQFQKVDELSGTADGMRVSALMLEDVQETYSPPPTDQLRRFGRGITDEQAESLQGCEVAMILNFGYPMEHVWDGMRAALRLTSAVARQTQGVLWDEETRQVFSPDTWDERRVEEWTEEVPNISRHTVIHTYRKGEYVRAITLGMTKFGLPDVVINKFSWSDSRTIGLTMNLFCQMMSEGAVATGVGEFDLDLKQIKNPKVRERQLSSLKPNATGIASLSLREGTWEEGDPENRLVEIGCDRYSGKDIHAKQQKMMSSLFGWEDSIDYVKHDEEVLAASRRANEKLPSLKSAVIAGLAPGEYILVKAPFDTPDGGREWMWVEVTSWTGDKIKGLLSNEPFNIPDLHAGQVVEVSEADVFDYIRRLPDGTQEGNETSKFMGKGQP